MTWYGLSVFSLAYVLAVAIPGPGVAAIIARSLGHGLRGAPAFIGGFLVGDLVWFTCAATGLAMLAQGAYSVFLPAGDRGRHGVRRGGCRHSIK